MKQAKKRENEIIHLRKEEMGEKNIKRQRKNK